MNILITGGASGLGEAITNKVASENMNIVYFTYNTSSEEARQLEDSLANTRGIKCNFINVKEVDNLIDQISTMDLDVLVNNAISSITNDHFHKIAIDAFTESFQHNIVPIIRITQHAIRIFRKKMWKIINILSSYLSSKPPIGLSEYVANKAYLLSLSNSRAIENSSFNITSNCVSPSSMQTNLTQDTDQRIIERMIKKNPQKRLLTTDEVADTVFFLLHSTQQINGINNSYEFRI
jgi:NAD(P)-dependent dehydrogenase (short-subunit alcohol dehydrogenase family)